MSIFLIQLLFFINDLSKKMSGSVIEKVVKLNAQSTGRDKVFRLLQYGSRIVWAYLEKRTHDKDMIIKLKNLEYSLSTARKLYRLGRSVDILYSALKSMHLEDPILRYTLTFSRINMALYFLADHMVWVERVGIAHVNKQKWARISYKLWLYYITMNLLRDFYEILRILNKYMNTSTVLRSPSFNHESSKLDSLYRFLVQHKEVTLDTIKNGCDIWLPLSLLGYASLSPGVVGLLGVISSIAGIFPLVDHTCKLLPS